jgi:mRNA interferase HigB
MGVGTFSRTEVAHVTGPGKRHEKGRGCCIDSKREHLFRDICHLFPYREPCYNIIMHIIARKRLKEYGRKYREAEEYLEAWYADAKKADWQKPTDITDAYSNARTIPNDRVVFNIKGNKYRLVVVVLYNSRRVLVRWFGKHSEYDKIDATTI